jgi:hypothetical protein
MGIIFSFWGLLLACDNLLFVSCFVTFSSAFGQISCLFGHVLPFTYCGLDLWRCDFWLYHGLLSYERASLVCCGSSSAIEGKPVCIGGYISRDLLSFVDRSMPDVCSLHSVDSYTPRFRCYIWKSCGNEISFCWL